MRFIFIIALLMQSLLVSADVSQSEINIVLQSSNNANELKYALIANNITQPLIGIGATVVLPTGMEFVRFEKGNFFEQNSNDQVTYLISPKSNNPQQVILGVASLGKNQSHGHGVIAIIYLKNFTRGASQAIKLESTVASGIENGKRVNYQEITWHISAEKLPNTGPSLEIVFLVVCFLITGIVLGYKNSSFSKVANLWYNGKNTKTNHYEIFPKKACCESTARHFSQEIRLAILGQLSHQSNHQESTKQTSSSTQTKPHKARFRKEIES